MPKDFIGIAENSHLIIPIGDWVLKTACDFIKNNRQLICDEFKLSVNISAIQLLQPDFVSKAIKLIEESGISPGFLELEITESCLLGDTELVIKKIGELREAGLSIALDDFGTGFSSLSYLRELPINTLKIDQSFVSSIFDSEKNRSLTSTIIAMGHLLGMVLVAEGVETTQQFDFLKFLECDKVQGFLLSRPVPEADVTVFMSEYN